MKPGWMDGDSSFSEEQPEISLKEMFETEMARNRLFASVGFFVVGFVLLVWGFFVCFVFVTTVLSVVLFVCFQLFFYEGELLTESQSSEFLPVNLTGKRFLP